MIPFFQWEAIHLGPIHLHVWGVMVSLGILAGLFIALRVARLKGLGSETMMDLIFWAIVSALIGSRVLYVCSEFAVYAAHPLDIFKVWEGGMAFSGGLLGAVVAIWLYTRRHHLPWREYVEAGIIALPLGIAIGRLGCFFIFDHPGMVTTFFLGEQYSDGSVRHNLGLYLSMEQWVLSILFAVLWIRNPQRRTGVYTAIFLLWYGVVRFFLDFLRATDLPNADERYLGLTIAQYIALFAVVGGLRVWYSTAHAIRTKEKIS